MAVTISSVLMLPLDVASAGATASGGIPMDILWLCTYICIAALVVVVIPFTYFYYESYDPDKG